MFSHVFSGSQIIFQGLLGQTQVAQNPQNMGLDQSGDQIPELDGMDFAVPLITMNQGTSGGLLFVNGTEFYFSVTSASASQLPPSFFGGAPASGATILSMSWSEVFPGFGVWSSPTVFATPADLGLANVQEVDALAVNVINGDIIFSTERQPGSTVAQLQHMSRTSGSPVVNDLLDGNGGAIGATLNLTDEDDIDAICGLDPEGLAFSHWIGTPYGPGQTFKALSLAIARERLVSSNLDRILLQITGWGSKSPSDGSITIEITVDGVHWIPFDSFPRGVRQDRIEREYFLPSVFLNSHIGVRARFSGTSGRTVSWMSVLKL